MRHLLAGKTATAVTSLSLIGAATLALAGSAGAAPLHPTGSSTPAAAAAPATAVEPQRIEALPAHTVPADGRAHLVTVAYRASGSVAVQALLESPANGPYLSPAQVHLDRRDPQTHRWQALRVGSQTGTLYTALPGHGTTADGGVRTVTYRVTIGRTLPATAPQPVLQPRLAVYPAQHTAAPSAR